MWADVHVRVTQCTVPCFRGYCTYLNPDSGLAAKTKTWCSVFWVVWLKTLLWSFETFNSSEVSRMFHWLFVGPTQAPWCSLVLLAVSNQCFCTSRPEGWSPPWTLKTYRIFSSLWPVSLLIHSFVEVNNIIIESLFSYFVKGFQRKKKHRRFAVALFKSCVSKLIFHSRHLTKSFFLNFWVDSFARLIDR